MSLLHDHLGYTRLHGARTSAFERDTPGSRRDRDDGAPGETPPTEVGLGLGAKFSNTLIVANDRGFPVGRRRGGVSLRPPLHVLAMHLVRRFRRAFGDRFPISFSAGIDRANFADAVASRAGADHRLLGPAQEGWLRTAAGLLPGARGAHGGGRRGDDRQTSCCSPTATASRRFERLGLDAEDPVAGELPPGPRAGGGDAARRRRELFERWVSEARSSSTPRPTSNGSTATSATPVRQQRLDCRARSAGISKLFDCITCDICVPVCPNDANFTFGSPGRADSGGQGDAGRDRLDLGRGGAAALDRAPPDRQLRRFLQRLRQLRHLLPRGRWSV